MFAVTRFPLSLCFSYSIISTVRHESNEFVGIPSLNPAFPPPSSSSLLSHIPLTSAPVHPAFILDMRQQSRPSVINKAPSTPKERQEGRENGAVGDDMDIRRNGVRNPRLENFHAADVAGKPSGKISIVLETVGLMLKVVLRRYR